MAKKKEKMILVGDGVYIGKKGTSNNYSYYFKIDGRKFRKTTKTSDMNRAAAIALDAHRDALEKKRTGKVVEKVSFKKLCKRYIASLEGETSTIITYHTEQIHRHLMPFFEKYDDISKINKGTINDYMLDRKTKKNEKTGKIASPRTLNRESGVLNQLFKFGSDYGWCETGLKFSYQSEKQSGRRPHFTLKQIETLVITSRKRIEKLQNRQGRYRGLTTHQMWSRLLLHDIILIILATGIRVDELSTIRWRDIDWKNSTIKLNKAGKKYSSRTLLVAAFGIRALKNIQDRRLEYLDGEALDQEERIQCLADGRFTKSMKKNFNALLEECNFSYKEDGSDKHTLTSLRHSYATDALIRKDGKITARMLAKQMGTSEKMIEAHYGHDVVEDYRDELLGEEDEIKKRKILGTYVSLEDIDELVGDDDPIYYYDGTMPKGSL